MNKRTFGFILGLAVLAAGIAWIRYGFLPLYAERITQQFSYTPPTPTASPSAQLTPVKKTPAEEALDTLTPEQRITQMIAAPLTIRESKGVVEPLVATDSARWIAVNNPGFVTLFGDRISSSSARSVTQRFASPGEENVITPIFAVDHEGGTVQRLSGAGFTILPTWKEMCEMPDNQRQQMLSESAQELSAVGVTVIFAPVIDTGANPALGTRICSPFASRNLENGIEWVQIFNRSGVTPVIKHFPGIGLGQKDLHFDADTQEIDSEGMRLFNIIASQHPYVGIMTTHVTVPLSGRLEPCSLSIECVALLKISENQLIFSDALEMKSANKTTLEETGVKAVEAGNMVLVFGPSVRPESLEKVKAAVLNKYAQDQDFKQVVDDNVRRILELKFKKK